MARTWFALSPIAPFIAAFTLVMSGTLVSPPPARAQDDPLIAKLVDLTKRKGEMATIGVRACTKIGLPDDGKDCSVYQLLYAYDGRDCAGDKCSWNENTHGFNVLSEQGTPIVRVLLINWNITARHQEVFLAGIDGKLQAALLVERIGGKWLAHKPVISPEARAGFVKEIAFWRAKQTDVEKRPDRKD